MVPDVPNWPQMALDVLADGPGPIIFMVPALVPVPVNFLVPSHSAHMVTDDTIFPQLVLAGPAVLN